MVEKEEKQLTVEEVLPLLQGAHLKRAPDGGWTLTLALRGELAIDTERVLPICADLKTKAKQRGKRGNPAQNWGKGSGFQKKSETE